MRIQCDSCEKNLASVMCCADEAALCADCDARIHTANKLATQHVRVDLLTALEPSKCDICQEKRGFFFCLDDRALLCRDCDVSIHTANALSCNHKRFLVPGTRVALEELKDDHPNNAMEPTASSTMSSQSSHCNQAPTLSSSASTLRRAGYTPSCCPPPQRYAQNAIPEMKSMGALSSEMVASLPSTMGAGGGAATIPGGGAMRKSSISEFLTDSVPGWRVDELLNFVDCSEGLNNSTDFASTKADAVPALGSDYDWTADLSLFEEQVFAMHEVPQFPPPATPHQLAAPPRSRHHQSRNRSSKQDIYALPNAYGDAFIVPKLRFPSSGPASSPLPKRQKRDLYY